MNRAAFLSDIKKVFLKHRIWPTGVLKLRDLTSKEWDEASSELVIQEENGAYPYKDTSGPFINFSINQIAAKAHIFVGKVNTQIMDKDKLLREGVVSPLDYNSVFHNRADWANHLKANGCVEIGNDFNNSTEKKREIKGDFDCSKELAQATYQVMDKYGH